MSALASIPSAVLSKSLWHCHARVKWTLQTAGLMRSAVLPTHPTGTAKISDFGMARFKLSTALVTKQPDAGTLVGDKM
jgi:hypothetical protein